MGAAVRRKPYDAACLKTMRPTCRMCAAGRAGALQPPRLLFAVVILATALLHAAPAEGHARTSSFSSIGVQDDAVTWRLRVAAADLLGPLGQPEAVPDGDAAKLLRPHLAKAAAYVAQRLHVQRAGQPCTQTEAGGAVSAADASAIEFRFRFTCGAAGPHGLRYDLFFDLDPLHSGFVQLAHGEVNLGANVFRTQDREVTVLLAPSGSKQAKRFWALGVEHIFTGYDHLAFLAGLLLMAAVVREERQWQGAATKAALTEAAKIVTSFTVAHSLTLALAALRPGWVPTLWVEPAIALSVAWVGAENWLPRQPRRRWVLAFALGLIHGFGFASVLQEAGLPESGFLQAVLAFNLGVESGQLALVILVLPALVWLSRTRPRLYSWLFLRAISFCLVVAGLIWFVLRLRG